MNSINKFKSFLFRRQITFLALFPYVTFVKNGQVIFTSKYVFFDIKTGNEANYYDYFSTLCVCEKKWKEVKRWIWSSFRKQWKTLQIHKEQFLKRYMYNIQCNTTYFKKSFLFSHVNLQKIWANRKLSFSVFCMLWYHIVQKSFLRKKYSFNNYILYFIKNCNILFKGIIINLKTLNQERFSIFMSTHSKKLLNFRNACTLYSILME